MVRYEAKGLDNFLKRMAAAPQATRKAAMLAVNHGLRRARTEGSREIARQVNLTKKYIDQRLTIRQFANLSRLEGVVAGRVRPTSLRRFGAKQATRKGKSAGVRVRVKRGGSKLMRRAFLINLKRGTGTLDSYNQGIAIRLKEGESIEGKKVPFDKEGDPGLFILYGPSVDQVFDTVRDDIHPGIEKEMTAEFSRQWARLI